jgi:hypothetical protein
MELNQFSDRTHEEIYQGAKIVPEDIKEMVAETVARYE